MRKLLSSALVGSFAFWGTASAGFSISQLPDQTPLAVGQNIVSDVVTNDVLSTDSVDYVGGGQTSGADIAVGTGVNVDYFTLENSTAVSDYTFFTITFTSKILGIAWSNSSLAQLASVLSFIAVDGLELDPPQTYGLFSESISIDGNTMSVGLSITDGFDPIDSFAVITAAPEPTSMAMFVGLLGCLGFAGWRRRAASATA